jgi:hypothetical protein
MQPVPNRDPWEQRGIESVTGQFGVPDWTALSPFGVAALGPARQPVQKMMALQGALARGIDLITSIWSAKNVAGRGRNLRAPGLPCVAFDNISGANPYGPWMSMSGKNTSPERGASRGGSPSVIGLPLHNESSAGPPLPFLMTSRPLDVLRSSVPRRAMKASIGSVLMSFRG